MHRAIGDAGSWGSWASSNGYTVDNNPAIGSVAWWSNSNTSGIAGHVAWVESISGLSVTVEQYNVPGYSGGYSEKTYASSTISGFIHFKDIATTTTTPASWNGVGSSTYIGASKLTAGQKMYKNQYMLSPAGNVVLTLQNDGNLVIYSGNSALWASNISTTNVSYVTVQADGNLVEYDTSGNAVWSSGSSGTSDSSTELDIQNDGNAVVYKSGSNAVWSSRSQFSAPSMTNIGGTGLARGQSIGQNQYVHSADGRYTLFFQSDGNLVLYAPGAKVLWSSGTGGTGGTYAILQNDNNLVIYGPNGGIWATNTSSSGTSTLTVQNDGNMVLYNGSNTAVWSTNTGGRLS